jgi:hypothetical protein
MVKSAEQVMAEIEAAIGGKRKYNLDIPDYLSILANHKGIDLGAPIDYSDFDISTHSTKKKKKKKNGLKPNFWDMISGTLGQPSGIFTDSAYHTIKDIKDKKKSAGEKLLDILFKDSIGGSIGRGIKNGAKEQWKDWTDGKASWGDVPLVGFLHGADKGWKRGDDIMEELGVKNRWGKVGGGIGLDIALDPLTYLTGGLSMATKLGKVAEVAKMAELGESIGIAGKFKKSDDFLQAASKVFKAKYAKYDGLSDDLVERVVARKVGKLAEELKTARNTTINSNINKWGVSVPFSNKMTGAIGNIREGSLLHRTEATVGNDLVKNLIAKGGNDSPSFKATLEQVVKTRYGVEQLGELTKTQFDDLAKHMEPLVDKLRNQKSLPDVKVTQEVVDQIMPQKDFARLMNNFRKQNLKGAGIQNWDAVKNQLNEILLQTGHDEKLRSSVGAHLAEMVSDYWKHTKTGMRGISKADRAARAESMKWASTFLKDTEKIKSVKTTVKEIHPKGNPLDISTKNARDINKVTDKLRKTDYNEVTRAKTKLEHVFDKHNPFDARTLKTGDKFVDSMADHIADANSRKLGETAMYTRGLEKVAKVIKSNKMSKKEMKDAIYYLEKKAPKSYGKDWVPSRNVKKLADTIRPLVKDIGDDDVAAGVLSNLSKNYFPHVVNKSNKALKEMMEFAERHKSLNGLKNENKFDKSRRSFKTIADRDDYIEELSKLRTKTTDPDELASIDKQLEHVEDMFDVDVVSALTRRAKEGVRARAVKEMQTKLSRYGMMKSLEKGSDEMPPEGLKRLDKDEVKKLGLSKDVAHYMHKDVLDGLKRIDDVFTNEGMNNAYRHLAAVSDIWRPLVTYYKPAHYINNMIGNTFTNLAAGVKTRDYNVARKLLFGYMKGKLSESEMKIMKNAYRHNVIAGGFLFDSKTTFEFAEPKTLEKVAKAIGDNKGIRKARKAGEIVDDIYRLANFVNGLDKYGNVERAANQVRTYLFNYNELTNADRGMRVAVPFWNWTKRNIPLQLRLLMENPKFILNTDRMRHLFNDGEKGEDWQKNTGIKVSKDRYTTVPAPANDLEILSDPLSFLGSTNPALKMPLEMKTNKKLYTGKPISYGSNELQPEDIIPYLMSNLGVGKNAYDVASGDSSLLEAIANMIKSTSKINPKGGGGN